MTTTLSRNEAMIKSILIRIGILISNIADWLASPVEEEEEVEEREEAQAKG